MAQDGARRWPSCSVTANQPIETAVIERTVAELAATFGNRLVTSDAVRAEHGHTTTWIACQPPDAVVFPQSTADVQAAVRICARHGVAVIPFGVGSSFEGGVNAPFGGVSLDFRDMNRVLAVHQEDFDCVVEPGITRKRLNDDLRDQGLFFPSIPAPTPRSAEWPRRALRAPPRFATAR